MCQPLNTNIIVEVVKGMLGRRHDLGKIQLQKLLYFLQESGVPLSYNYEIYHYGPYCFELASNLDSLNSSGVLDVTPDKTGYGYHISKGKFIDEFYGKDPAIITKYKKEIDFVINNFYPCNASEIELKATIHFVHKLLKESKYPSSKDDVIKKVQELKPKFTPEYIAYCYDNLNEVTPLN